MGMQDTPDIQMVLALNVENHERPVPKRECPEPRKIKFISATRRADAGILPDQGHRLFERPDKPIGHSASGFPDIIVNDPINIPLGLLAQHRASGRHDDQTPRTRDRRRSKYGVSAVEPGAD